MRILFLTLFLSFSTLLFAGGGWIQPVGEGFVMLSGRYMSADKFYNSEGKVVGDVNFTAVHSFATNLYAEYGIAPRLELKLNTPLVYHISKDGQQFTSGAPDIPTDQVTSLGDTQFGLRYGLLHKGPIKLAIGYELKVPFGNSSGGDTGLLQTGNGAWENGLRTDVSGSITNKWYASAYAKYNLRSEDFSDEMYFGLETGYNVYKHSYLIAKLDLLHSFQNGDADPNSALFANNIEYTTWTLQALIGIKEYFGIELATSSAFAAKNILASPAYEAGIYYKIGQGKKKQAQE